MLRLMYSLSVTLYADGDRLVLDFGNGEPVILDSDETVAALQIEQAVNGEQTDNQII
ncbi:MAG: hypothetical protein K5770_04430 [Lachnospiraceae bacterium]|nr:hypothetical protein [Lachnospiraceae bacterium]